MNQHVTQKFKYKSYETLCKDVGNTLSKYYPGYSWCVGMQGKMVVIRSGEIHQFAWCMTINPKDFNQSPERFTKLVVNLGGELLERAHLNTTRRIDGEDARILEGSEKKPMIIPRLLRNDLELVIDKEQIIDQLMSAK